MWLRPEPHVHSASLVGIQMWLRPHSSQAKNNTALYVNKGNITTKMPKVRARSVYQGITHPGVVKESVWGVKLGNTHRVS